MRPVVKYQGSVLASRWLGKHSAASNACKAHTSWSLMCNSRTNFVDIMHRAIRDQVLKQPVHTCCTRERLSMHT